MSDTTTGKGQIMQNFYEFLDEENYFWDRKDKNTIYVLLSGYKVFSDEYHALMNAAKQVKATNIAAEYDSHSMKTVYWFKHK